MKLDFLTMSVLRQIKRVNAVILHVKGGEGEERGEKKLRKSTNKTENDGNNYLYWVLKIQDIIFIYSQFLHPCYF
jgi:hypothetical protein